MPNKMKFQMVFKHPETPDVILYPKVELDYDQLTVGDGQRIIETEQFLERLTGYRVHINQVL